LLRVVLVPISAKPGTTILIGLTVFAAYDIPRPTAIVLLDDGMAMLLAAVILLVLRSEFSRP
jgi:hypothetical protein